MCDFKPGDKVVHSVVGRVRIIRINERGHLLTSAVDRVAVFRALRPEDCRRARA